MDAYEQIEVIGRGSYGRFVCGSRGKGRCAMWKKAEDLWKRRPRNITV